MIRLRLVLCLTAAVMVSGVVIWEAEATPITGAVDLLDVIKGYSAVQKVGCMFGTHRCPAGTKWSCAKYPGPMGAGKKCVCRPC